MAWLSRLHHYFHEIPAVRKILSFLGYGLLLSSPLSYFWARFQARQNPRFFVATLRHGPSVELFLPRDQIAFGTVFLQEDYRHPCVLQDPLRTIVDLGANIGCFTLWAQQRHPDARFFAVEPDPEAGALAQKNFLRNHLTVPLVQGAAGAPAGSALFFRDAESSACSSLFRPDQEPATTITVPVHPLPELLAQWGLQEVDLLKLDIEGAEYAVLKDLSDSDWNRLHRLCLEYHQKNGEGAETLLALLQQKGFKTACRGTPKIGMIFAWKNENFRSSP